MVRAHAISPLCGRFRAFCRAGPAPQSEPSCLMPAVSHYSQVPDVGLGHSRCWRKIPRLLRSALFHMPLHSANSRSGPPTCWQRRPYEVTNRTGRAPGTRPGKHVTLPEPVCPRSVLWWLCRTDTPAPGRQKGLLVLDLGAPSGRLNHDRLRSISGLRQVQAATLMRTALSAGDDQAGPRTALLPTCHNQVLSRPLGPGRVFKRSCVCPACSVGINLTPLNATASRVVSSQLLVALHTALARVEPSYAAMPSPSAKLKVCRRLPKRLRLSGEQPTGDLARARAEAADRYARGESNTKGQHSCCQETRHSDDTAADNDHWQGASWEWQDGWRSADWGDVWQSSTSSASREAWVARPKPPLPPPPRWRPMQQAGETTGETTQSTAAAVKSRLSARKEPTAAPEAALDAGHGLLEEAPLAPSTVEPTPASEQSAAGLDDAMVEVEVEVEGGEGRDREARLDGARCSDGYRRPGGPTGPNGSAVLRARQ